jgi:putative membrane protein
MNKLWLFIFSAVFIWSAVYPKDYFTWALEVAPAVIGLAILACTRRNFRSTNLAYALILAHCVILMVGGHYTYAEVPLFDRLKDVFGWERNNYDKIGHFAQGFAPAIIAREILIRNRVVSGRAWLNTFVVSVCLAISALYELLEWVTAELTGEAAEAFLGTQGYIWDTQSDMAFALLGAVAALVLLSRLHDAQIMRLARR